MGRLKCLQELTEDLLLSFLACYNVRVFVGRVDATDVVDVNHTTAICVHLGEGTHNDGFTVGVHGATDCAKELVVLNETTAVKVEVSEEDLDLTL